LFTATCLLSATGFLTAAGFLGSALLAAAGGCSTASLLALLSLLSLIDTQKALGRLSNHARHLLELSRLLTLLIRLSELLQGRLALVLVAAALGLHNLADPLSESLGELAGASLLSSLGTESTAGLLGFIAKTELVSGCTIESLSLTGGTDTGAGTACSGGSELGGLEIVLNWIDSHVLSKLLSLWS
jgi:hypothetical protein